MDGQDAIHFEEYHAFREWCQHRDFDVDLDSYDT